MCLVTIERYRRIICRALFRTDSKLSYDRTLLAIEKLGMAIVNSDADERKWCLGESEDATVTDLVAGAYWYTVDYHGGQASPEYRVSSVLSDIFNPGSRNGPEPQSQESSVYNALVERLKECDY
jgi:hypothetical protein